MAELYKGEKVKIEDLKPEDVFQRVEDEPGEHKIPRVAIVQTNAKSYMDNRNLGVFSFHKNVPKQLTIPGGVEVQRLTGKYAKLKKEAYEKDKITNLQGHMRRIVATSGSDPEIFVVDKEGKMIPAFRFLPPKEKPVTIANTGETVYFDGYQAEFTVKAGSCHGYMFDSVQRAMARLLTEARKKYPGATLSLKSTFEVPLSELAEEPEEFVQFGCAPSLNAYGMENSNMNGREVPFRMTGGHIHMGIGGKTPEQMIPIVKALDAILGVSLVSLFAEYDNPLRRTMYGKVGEYRLPPHGLEYRTPSNAWMMHPAIANLVFDLGRVAAAVGAGNLMGYWKVDEAEVIQAVQNCDVELAREILNRNKEMMMAVIRAAYPTLLAAAHERAFSTIIEGSGSLVKNPQDIVGNWKLEGGWVTHCGMTHGNWATTYTAKGKI